MRRSTRAWLCAAGCCLATVANAAPAGGARAVIERYVLVTGGRAALEADTLVHRRGRLIEAGVSGTVEDWRRGRDHVVLAEHLGLLRTRRGYDGAQGWSTDFTSRKVGPLE